MNSVSVVQRPRPGERTSGAAEPGRSGRRSVALMSGLLRIADAGLLLSVGIVLAVLLPGADGLGTGRQIVATLTGTAVFVTLAAVAGQYDAAGLDRRIGRLAPVAGLWGLSVMLLLTLAFLWDGSVDLARGWLVAWFVAGGGALVVWRAAAAGRMQRWRAEGRLAERIAVIGAADQVRELLGHLSAPGREGDALVLGVYDATGTGAKGAFGAHVDGSVEELLRDAPELGLDAVLVALPWSEREAVAALCLRLRDMPVDVRLAPDLAAYDLPAGAPRTFAGRMALEVWGRPLRDWRGVVKRAEDLVIGFGLILLFAPVMLLVALAVRLDSPGPVLLRQRRYGFGGTPIMVFKFRSMRHDVCDHSGARATVRDDPRVTRVGRFLRRTSLDELPQLFNVLLGEMSLVGPRAHPVEMRVGGRYYHEVVSHYAARHRMKPGITGLAQINGCRGLVDTLEKAQRRLDYDLHYVENWSLGLDIRILFATIFHGFVSESAF